MSELKFKFNNCIKGKVIIGTFLLGKQINMT